MDISNREKTFFYIMRNLPTPGSIKPDIKAAISGIDDFLETNQTAINNAFPQPFRGTASMPTKALIIAYVCMRRAGALSVEEDNI